MSVLDAKAIEVHRSGEGAPLVLLHCLGVDHQFWDFARDLGSDFTLLRYDLPGHGETPVPRGAYSIADQPPAVKRPLIHRVITGRGAQA